MAFKKGVGFKRGGVQRLKEEMRLKEERRLKEGGVYCKIYGIQIKNLTINLATNHILPYYKRNLKNNQKK